MWLRNSSSSAISPVSEKPEFDFQRSFDCFRPYFFYFSNCSSPAKIRFVFSYHTQVILLIYLWYTRYCMLQIDISFLTYHREVFSVNTILGRCHAAVVTSMVYFDTGLVCGVHKHCKWIHLYYRCIYGVGSRGGAQDLVAWNYRFCRIEWCYSRWTFQYEP